jgi:hypothetical protein
LADLHEGERVTLFGALQTALSLNYLTGPRVIVIQICLSLAGLVLQMSDGPNVMLQFLSTLFLDPRGRAALLTFLTILPEEITTNTRIPISVSGTCIHPAEYATQRSPFGVSVARGPDCFTLPSFRTKITRHRKIFFSLAMPVES